MFDITIVAAVTVQVPGGPYTISNIYRLDLDGDTPEALVAFIDYVKAYEGVAAAQCLTGSTD